jgi:CRP/FNR family cyclic AMP-dependent transcriptional regulator
MSPGAIVKKSREFDPEALLATVGEGRRAMLFPKKQTIFAQGDPSDAVFYLQAGKVKLAVVSKTGKEATIVGGENPLISGGIGSPIRL